MVNIREIFDIFVAGWTSGAAGLTVSYPLDTVKVRLQARNEYGSAWQCILRIKREEGIRGFYKGMLSPLLAAGCIHSVFFLGYGSTLSAMDADSRSANQENLSKLIFASVGGAILQWIPSCPIEVIKTKLQVQRENIGKGAIWRGVQPAFSHHVNGDHLVFTSPYDCFRQTLRFDGLHGLYRGGSALLIRDVIGYCFYVPVYEYVLRQLVAAKKRRIAKSELPKKMYLKTDRHIPESMVAGGVAGVACWWSVLPLDVIKSRLQADDLVNRRYLSAWHCAVDTFRRDGPLAFTRGWHVAALRGFPACACIFVVYEETLRFLHYGQHMIDAVQA